MITKFESTEEKKFLHDLLLGGINSTEYMLEELPKAVEVHKKQIKFRQRCFAYLEIEDPEAKLYSKYMKPNLVDVYSELEETKCDVQNLFTRIENLDELYGRMNIGLNKRIDILHESIGRMEESLINRIQENTGYIGKATSGNGIMMANSDGKINIEMRNGYDKLSEKNKVTIDLMIDELNKEPGSVVIDYMIGS